MEKTMVAMAPCLPTRPTITISGGGATLSGLCRPCRMRSRLTDKKPRRTNRSARLFGAFAGVEPPVDGGRQAMRLPVWFQNAGSSGRQSVLWVTGQSLLAAAEIAPHSNLRGAKTWRWRNALVPLDQLAKNGGALPRRRYAGGWHPTFNPRFATTKLC